MQLEPPVYESEVRFGVQHFLVFVIAEVAKSRADAADILDEYTNDQQIVFDITSIFLVDQVMLIRARGRKTEVEYLEIWNHLLEKITVPHAVRDTFARSERISEKQNPFGAWRFLRSEFMVRTKPGFIRADKISTSRMSHAGLVLWYEFEPYAGVILVNLPHTPRQDRREKPTMIADGFPTTAIKPEIHAQFARSMQRLAAQRNAVV